MTLRWPVRCLNCLKRTHIPVWKALYAYPASMAHSGQFRTQASWQEFTAPDLKDKDAA